MNMAARPSQERHRKMMKIQGEGTRNAGMDRQRQLETPLQKSTHKSGNNVRMTKKKITYVLNTTEG
jgi:hypothetical protein